MSRFFKDNSPAKKAKPEQTSDGAGSDHFKTVGEVYPGFVCPLDRKVLLKKYTKTGRPWIVCSGKVQNDPDSCQFSANLFSRDRVKEGEKSKIACKICDVPVEFTPSIGEPTGEKKPLTGKPVFENTHVFFPHCWGKQTEDPVSGKSLLVHCTAATGAVVGTTCKAYDPTTPFDDLKLGCTGSTMAQGLTSTMTYDQQLAEYEHHEALLTEYYINLYEECFYTDSAWQRLISDAENAPFPVEDAQLAEFERFEADFDRYVQDQWLSFCTEQD